MTLSIKLTQLNGLIGDIFGFLGDFVQNMFGALFGWIFVLLYQLLVAPFFLLVDAIQLMFKKLAGLDTYYVGNQGQSGDIVLTLINNKTVQNVFWSLLILGVILLIICTIVALVKTETQAVDDKSRKSKSKIFSESIRALFNFFMVPVVAILGIFMGNALLQSLDQATSGGSERISTIIFKLASYEANRARKDETFALDIRDKGTNDMGVLKGSTQEDIALAIDSAFTNFTTIDHKSFDFPTTNWFSKDGTYIHVLALTVFSYGTSLVPRDYFSIYDASMVYYYYDLTSFNYIIAWIGIFFVTWVLFSTAIGMIKRIFKLTVLLIVSPPIVAISPLDNGKALGEWKKQFLGSTLSAYSTVVALNLVMMLLGPVSNIEFFRGVILGMNMPFLNNFMTLLITVGALMFFKGFSADLAKMIGAENASDDGGKIVGDMTKKVASGAMIAAGGIGAVANLSKSVIAKDAGDTETAQKYKDMANARFKQARQSFTTLATNGTLDNIRKVKGDSLKASGIKGDDKHPGALDKLKQKDASGKTGIQKFQDIKVQRKEEQYRLQEDRENKHHGSKIVQAKRAVKGSALGIAHGIKNAGLRFVGNEEYLKNKQEQENRVSQKAENMTDISLKREHKKLQFELQRKAVGSKEYNDIKDKIKENEKASKLYKQNQANEVAKHKKNMKIAKQKDEQAKKLAEKKAKTEQKAKLKAEKEENKRR